MSQRWSEYARRPFDEYNTPTWATKAVVPFIPKDSYILEPACGSGKMAEALREEGFKVDATDIQDGNEDFLKLEDARNYDAIITNPPYNLAAQFVEHALKLTEPTSGVVAMLLRTDFDHAKTRRRLFADHRAFSTKLILTKRIVWFERPGAAPSFNHAWFIWDWFKYEHEQPTIAWDFQ